MFRLWGSACSCLDVSGSLWSCRELCSLSVSCLGSVWTCIEVSGAISEQLEVCWWSPFGTWDDESWGGAPIAVM